MNSDRIFSFTIVISILFHGILIAHKTDLFKIDQSRIIKIPVVLEQKKIEKPRPKPKPKPKPKSKPKPKLKKPQPVEKKIEKPKELRKEITKVSEAKGGLRAGELVDAPAGEYEKGQGTGLTPEKEVDVIAEIKKYLKTIRKKVAKNKVYPGFAQRHGITGKVKVSFYIADDGSFEKVIVKKSSGSSILDEAAVETIVKLSGKIRRPELTGKKKVKTTVTIKYELS